MGDKTYLDILIEVLIPIYRNNNFLKDAIIFFSKAEKLEDDKLFCIKCNDKEDKSHLLISCDYYGLN